MPDFSSLRTPFLASTGHLYGVRDLASNRPLSTQRAKTVLEFMRSFDYRRRASLLPVCLVIVMFPLLAWAQDSLSREQAIRPMHVQKNTQRFSNGKPKVEYSFYRGKDGPEVLHGKYITWSESGQKESSCNYLHGEKEGLASGGMTRESWRIQWNIFTENLAPSPNGRREISERSKLPYTSTPTLSFFPTAA